MNNKIIALIISIFITNPVFAEQSVGEMCKSLAPCLKGKYNEQKVNMCFTKISTTKGMQDFLKESNQSLEHFLKEFETKEVRNQLKLTCKNQIK